nr:hypothetical protein CFP56_68879 [Quercus suber]
MRPSFPAVSREFSQGGGHPCSYVDLVCCLCTAGCLPFMGPGCWSSPKSTVNEWIVILNRHEGLANIRQRLDQCLCDQEWQTLFPKAGIRHLVNANSDHNRILLDTHMENSNLDKPFRFEAMWTRDETTKMFELNVLKLVWRNIVTGLDRSSAWKSLGFFLPKESANNF